MNMMEATKACFSKYLTISGRARRAEYWWFYLFVVIVSIILGVVDGLLAYSSTTPALDAFAEVGIFGTIWSLVTLIPSITAAARRLHDTDRSGWWQLLILIPIIGWIILIVWLASRGTEGPNRFGADPLRPHNIGEVFA